MDGSCCRAGGRAVIAIAALDVAARAPAATFAPIPAGSPAARRCRRRAGRDARLRAGRRRPADRRASDRQQRALPRRLRGARRAASTAPSSSPTARTTLDGVVDARGLQAGGITLARLTANAKLVNGSGTGSRGCSPAGAARPSSSPPSPTCLARPHPRSPAAARSSAAVGPRQAAVLTRSGDGWQLAPTSLRFAGGTRRPFGPQRLAARSPRPVAEHAAAKCSTSPGPISTSAASRPDGSTMPGRATAAGGSTSRSAASAGPAWCSRRSRSMSGSPQSSTATRRRCARWRSAAGRPSAGRRRALLRSATAPLVAELLNAPLFAQLRYAGPADTLVAPVGNRNLRPVGPDRDRRRHRRPAGRSRSSAARCRTRMRGSKARSPAWSIDQLAAEARFSGPQLVFSQLAGTTSGRRMRSTGAGRSTFSGGAHRARPVVHRHPGAAAQPRRCRRARSPAR